MRHILLISLVSSLLFSMTLTQTIESALKHNNTLKLAKVELDRTKEQKKNKFATNFGRVDILASYDHYNMPRTLAPLTPSAILNSPGGAGTIPTTKDLVIGGITYNVTLFNGFLQQSNYKISDLTYKNSSIKYKLNKEELIYNIRSLYLTLLALQEQEVAQKNFTLAQEKLLKSIALELKLGSKAKIDLLKAKNSVEESYSQLSAIEVNISILQASINSLIGEHKFGRAESIEITVPTSKYILHSDYNLDLLNRVKASELQVKVGEKKVTQSRASYYPKVDFNSYYGKSLGPNDTTNYSPTTGEKLISKGDWNSQDIWQMGLKLKWNITDFGSSSAKNEEAKLSLQKAKLQQDGIKIELNKNIVTALNKIKLAIANFKSATAQYNLLEESENIDRVRYENNTITLSDLLNTTAKKELSYAKMINSKYEYKKATYYLDYLLEKGNNGE
ncbi:MAG: hypothetical protein GQ570_02265 [Helicobacteraceae bacterium]|nr:hypothetical protein [Helicobacteraceae bacterium]